jgi:hypothetical protein
MAPKKPAVKEIPGRARFSGGLWLVRCRLKPKESKTVNHALTVLSALLQKAVGWGV